VPKPGNRRHRLINPAAGKEEAALFSGAPGQPARVCEVFSPVAASPSETKLIKIRVFI
jgi:hypothetical protein